MARHQTFAALLDDLIRQDGRHVRQLSQATAERFGPQHQVPNNTISRWLRGEVNKPRNWPDIVKLSAVLRLSQDDMHRLLRAAGHDGLTLYSAALPVADLFDFWQAPPPDRTAPFQVPPQPAHFIGRTEAVGNLERYLCSSAQSRVCLLLGMAGVGKTTLAANLAFRLQDYFSDGVLWVSLQQSDPMSALLGIAAAYEVDVAPYQDIGTRSSKVRELLATKKALLVLDNAEADSELRPLLPSGGHCAVLITSRRHNLAVTDSAYRLSLLPFDLEKEESLALFRQILGDPPVEAESELYQQIAAVLGHLPLAVNIAAQRLRHEPGWTAAELLARLEQAGRLDLLSRGDQQVRLSFDFSYQALPEADRQLFALLALFPGSFTAVYVAQIVERPLWEVEDGLRRLYSLSLLLAAAGNRYQLHPLLHDFSREQPQDAGWQPRFVDTFMAIAQEEGVLAAEIHNVIAAISLARQMEMTESEITIVTAIYPYLQRKGQLEQAARLLQAAEETARRTDSKTALMHILHQSGYTAMKQGHPNQAESYYQEALLLAQEAQEPGQTAAIMLKLGALAYRRGRLEEAQQFYTEALLLARQVQDQSLIAGLLTNLGLAEAARGGLTEAIIHYEEALTIARKIKDNGLAINILQNLGDMQEERGDYAQARHHYEEGLALAKAQKDPEMHSRMLGNLGAVVCHLGNYSEASAFFRQGLALAEANGLSIQIYRQQANLGQAAVLRGQFRQANTHYQEALALARELGFPEDLGMVLNQAGESYLAQDVYREAAECFSEALQIAEAGNLLRVRPLSLFGLARIAAARGNLGEARRLGQQSRKQLVTIGHRKANEVWWWLQELSGEIPPD